MAKFIYDVEHYKDALNSISTFSRTHNITRKDIELLFDYCPDLENGERLDGLKRNIIIRFFSLIEGDLYHLNKIDPYPNYKDKDDFETKFKSTIKQVLDSCRR